jgi:hypothetical protein
MAYNVVNDIVYQVSNAFKLEGVGWEVTNSVMNQVGSCNYPNYGPKSVSHSSGVICLVN